MKVLIADDEKKVAQLIYRIVDWEQWGLEVIGVVSDGALAMEAIRTEKPDIVITDIRMPGLNGIELIQETRKEEKQIYFVIISGYSEFQYARQALKLGVEDYLLKPVKKKDLTAVLDRIVGKRIVQEADARQKETMEKELLRTREQAGNNFLQALIANRGEWMRTENRIFAGRCFRILTAGVYTAAMQYEESKEAFFHILSKIQTLLGEYLKPGCLEMMSTIWKNEVVCLLNGDDLEAAEYDRALTRIQTELSGIQMICPGAKVIFGVGEPLYRLEEFSKSFDRIHLSMLGRFQMVHQGIFWEKEACGDADADITAVLTSQMRRKLNTCIEAMDSAGVQQVIGEAARDMSGRLSEYGLIQKVYLELVNLFLFEIRKYSGTSPLSEELKEGIGRVYRFRDLMNWLGEQCAEMIVQVRRDRQNSESKPILCAKQYISEHCGEPLTLELVANKIGFNATYFSSTFKKATGENFVDYLTRVRMDKAKIMLAQSETDLNIISERVGYASLKYFSKIFKRYTGISPSEYRKLYG